VLGSAGTKAQPVGPEGDGQRSGRVQAAWVLELIVVIVEQSGKEAAPGEHNEILARTYPGPFAEWDEWPVSMTVLLQPNFRGVAMRVGQGAVVRRCA
jgi:hypothetical protein